MSLALRSTSEIEPIHAIQTERQIARPQFAYALRQELGLKACRLQCSTRAGQGPTKKKVDTAHAAQLSRPQGATTGSVHAGAAPLTAISQSEQGSSQWVPRSDGRVGCQAEARARRPGRTCTKKTRPMSLLVGRSEGTPIGTTLASSSCDAAGLPTTQMLVTHRVSLIPLLQQCVPVQKQCARVHQTHLRRLATSTYMLHAH